jgi:hypothetical protein
VFIWQLLALFGDVLDEDDPRLALASLPVKHEVLKPTTIFTRTKAQIKEIC